jgi:hypothetical protein
MVFWVVTPCSSVAERAVFIFWFDVYRVRNTLGCMIKLLEKGIRTGTQSETMGINGQKRALSAISKIFTLLYHISILF